MPQRNLLSIATEAARRAGLHAPATIVNNNEKTARQLLVAADDTIREMRRAAANNGGWGAQQVAGTLTTVAGQDYYDLPDHYEGLIPGAVFFSGSPFWLLGPSDPFEWRAVEAGTAIRPVPNRWRIQHNQIFIQPTPTVAQTVFFEFLSRAMIDSVSAGAWDVAVWDTAVWNQRTVIDRFLEDSDIPRVPDDIVSLGVTWRMLRDMERPYADLRADYERQLGVAIARDKGGPQRSKTMTEFSMNSSVVHPLDTNAGVIVL